MLMNKVKQGIRKKYAQILHNFSVKYAKLNQNDEFKSLKGLIFEILLFGLIGSFASTLFKFNINLLNILAIGSFLWLLKEKIVPMITEIFGSLNIVKIYGR
jgi:hypothetical protein